MPKLTTPAWLLIAFTTLIGAAFGNTPAGAAVGVGIVFLVGMFL